MAIWEIIILKASSYRVSPLRAGRVAFKSTKLISLLGGSCCEGQRSARAPLSVAKVRGQVEGCKDTAKREVLFDPQA